MHISIAVIGGSGVYDPAILEGFREEELTTPFGQVFVATGSIKDKKAVFLARHGAGHSIPPHLVNYRANIWALRQLGVKNIIATAAVGSLNIYMKPGQLVFLDQFLDFTKSRAQTFAEKKVLHLDMTTPYCPELREHLAGVAGQLGLAYHNGGTYVGCEGPRFETPAEIRMFRHLGGDVVGMTGVPEVILAREAGLCYAAVAIVTNFAAGISARPLSHKEVIDAMEQSADNLLKLLIKSIDSLDSERTCSCQESLLDSLGI